MEEKKKKIVTFIGTLFVAIMFVGSYAAFNNNSGNSSTSTATTTVQGGATYFVSGNANAVVTGYSQLATVSLESNNTALSSLASNELAQLQNNGSISNYVAQGNGFQIFTQNMNAYKLQQLLASKLGSANVSVNASTSFSLPRTLPLTYRNQIVDVKLTNTNFTAPASPLQDIGTNVTVVVHALVYANGGIYDNQITITT
ncbi:MAG: hypothetical protein LVQ95_04500 [Candidatus Micrarchaeales archaeon]|nr:hypothetical protein [Candidatus Micrarchaeales archaeon]